MDQEVKNISIYCSVFVLFLLAIVSWIHGCSPGVCAGRALLGALIMYSIVSLAGNLIVRILIGAMVESKMEQQKQESKEE